MYCPKCGNEQLSNDTRFCSKCGIALGIAGELIGDSSQQLQREKREMAGIGLTIATVIMLFNFLLVYGIVTLPHLVNPVFFWIWLSFVVVSLLVAGIGLTQLIKGGFFRRLKDRELQLKLMKAQDQRRVVPPTEVPNRELASATFDHASVTETTTRNLEQKVPVSRDPDRR